eukprot:9425402-Ditylum_brightwellii.AAC.1
MVHPRNCVGAYGTLLFHCVDNSDDGADKHLTHLLQAVDCHLIWKSKQNEHVVGNKDNGVVNGDDNGGDDSIDNGVDHGVDNGVDGANKHLTHLSQAVDCCPTERSK